MTTWTAWLAAMLALVASSALAQQAPPRKLAHDPFERPVVQQLMKTTEPPSSKAASPSADAVARPAASPAAGSPAAAAAPVTAAELRAVMVGGTRPLVNLGGTILGIGDSVDGYRLVEVRERSAMFEKDGQRSELALGSKQER